MSDQLKVSIGLNLVLLTVVVMMTVSLTRLASQIPDKEDVFDAVKTAERTTAINELCVRIRHNNDLDVGAMLAKKDGSDGEVRNKP